MKRERDEISDGAAVEELKLVPCATGQQLKLVPCATGQEGIFELPNSRWQVLFVTEPEQLCRVCGTFADATQASAIFASLAEMHAVTPADTNGVTDSSGGAAAVAERKLNAQRDLRAFERAQSDTAKFNQTMFRDRELRLVTGDGTGWAAVGEGELQEEEGGGEWIEAPVDQASAGKWRKYGRKSAGTEHTVSFYRCAIEDCPVEKKTERHKGTGEVSRCCFRGGDHTHATAGPGVMQRAGSCTSQDCAVCVKPIGTKCHSNCSVCFRAYHVMCLEVPDTAALQLPKMNDWVCNGCKVCLACMRGDNETRIVTCDKCDKPYHTYCLNPPLSAVPAGGWRCPSCVKCLSCGAQQPGSSTQSRWRANFTLCEACNRLMQQNEFCPVCRVVYRATDTDPMVGCDSCPAWVHISCDGIEKATYDQMSKEETEYHCPVCRSYAEKQKQLRRIQTTKEIKAPKHPKKEDRDPPRCCVCASVKASPENKVLSCKACKINVHENCYGVHVAKEAMKDWHCACCTAKVTGQCILCGQDGGAMLRTQDGRWGHVLCALWLPELGFLKTTQPPVIEGLKRLDAGRWKLRCMLCNKKQGVCIQCASGRCAAAFHPSCAREAGFKMTIKELGDKQDLAMLAFCPKHVKV